LAVEAANVVDVDELRELLGLLGALPLLFDLFVCGVRDGVADLRFGERDAFDGSGRAAASGSKRTARMLLGELPTARDVVALPSFLGELGVPGHLDDSGPTNAESGGQFCLCF
jgi:hypothetical protein